MTHGEWEALHGEPDHLFDVCKMFYFLKDFAMHSLYKKRYRFGQAPSLLRHWDKKIKQDSDQKTADIKKSNWFILR